MNAEHLQALCEDAMRRITSHINRAAGQHQRAIRKLFSEARHAHDKNTELAVPTTDRPGAMVTRADRSACPPAARTAAGRTALMREIAADVTLSIVLGIGFALLTLHALNALFY
jgi:hypothetical protein